MRVYASLAVGGSRFAALGSQSSRRPLIADYYPLDSRGRVLRDSSARWTQAGELVSLLVVGVLVTVVGWRTANLILTVPILLLGLVMLIFLREPMRGYFEKRAMGFDNETSAHEDPPQSFGEAWRTIWAVRMLRRLFVAQMFAQIAAAERLPAVLPRRPVRPQRCRAEPLAFPHVIIALVLRRHRWWSRRRPEQPVAVERAARLRRDERRLPDRRVLVLGRAAAARSSSSSLGDHALRPGALRPSFQAIFSQIIPAKVRGQGFRVLALSTLPVPDRARARLRSVVSVYGFRAAGSSRSRSSS